MPSPVDLILRSGHRPRREGRTTPMQGLQDVCIATAFAGATKELDRLETITLQAVRIRCLAIAAHADPNPYARRAGHGNNCYFGGATFAVSMAACQASPSRTSTQ